MDKAPERIWAAKVTDNYGEWQTSKDGLPRPVEYVRAEAAERLARVVTDAMANAMLEFVHSKKASTLTNTEMFRQGIELALAEPAGELHGPYAWLSGDRSMSEDIWTLSDDPQENSAEYFSIPLYAKVDPFKNKVIEPAEDVAKARIERLQDAIEGECDGLAIDEERSRSILDYLDMGAEPAGEAAPEPVAYPKIMYVCEHCHEHNPEMCGHDRTDIYVTPDGRWLCDGCLDEEGVPHRDCVSPPTLYTSPVATPPASAIREAAETARACLAGLVSAGHNCPSPDPDQIEKAFWALDSALAGSAE